MSASPSISIVIAAYNAGAFLASTLDSLRSQSKKNWECIVVDDGSTDDTAAIARDYGASDERFRLVRQARSGVSAARNFGLAESAPAVPFVYFLDADDTLQPDTLHSMERALETHPDWVGVHGKGVLIDEHGNGIPSEDRQTEFQTRLTFKNGRVVPLTPEEETDHLSLSIACNIIPSVVLCRKSVARECGLFDVTLAQSEDWDFFYRMSRYGEFGFLNCVVAHKRLHATNATLDHKATWEGIKRVRCAIYRDPHLTEQHRRLLHRSFRRMQADLLKRRTRNLQEEVRRLRPGGTVRAFIQLALTAVRFLRGYPSLHD